MRTACFGYATALRSLRHDNGGACPIFVSSERLFVMCVTKAKIGCLALLLVAGLLVSGSAARADANLRYKFKAGEKLNYEMEQKMNMEMSVAGQNIKMEITQTIDMVWNI